MSGHLHMAQRRHSNRYTTATSAGRSLNGMARYHCHGSIAGEHLKGSLPVETPPTALPCVARDDVHTSGQWDETETCRGVGAFTRPQK